MCQHQWEPFAEPVGDDRFERCRVCRVIRTVAKAARNQCLAATNSGLAYYSKSDANTIIGGIPQNRHYTELHRPWFEQMAMAHRADLPTVLEVGAGIGLFVPQWLAWGWQVTCVEYDHWAAMYLRHAYPPIRAVQGDFLTADIDPAYDAVVACHSLEHFHEADRAFQRMVDHVAPGGHLYVEVPDQSDLYVWDHFWHFSPETLPLWMKAAGLELIAADAVSAKRGTFLHVIGRKPVDSC